jgi:hypothetical protein
LLYILCAVLLCSLPPVWSACCRCVYMFLFICYLCWFILLVLVDCVDFFAFAYIRPLEHGGIQNSSWVLLCSHPLQVTKTWFLHFFIQMYDLMWHTSNKNHHMYHHHFLAFHVVE